MRFHDEVVQADDLEVDKPRARGRASARSRWPGSWSSRCTAKFDPADYEDTYREAVLELIEAQGQGRGDPSRTSPSPSEEPADLRPPCRRASGRVLTMPRTIWNGSLSFGLVNVPVSLTSAARDLDLHFRQLHEQGRRPDRAAPLLLEGGRRRSTGRRWRAASSSDKGKQVVVTDLELATVQPRKTRTIDIEAFVDIGRGRPDLLRPPLVPGAVRRERGHAARLPAAGEGDGVHRPRRAGALRHAHARSTWCWCARATGCCR